MPSYLSPTRLILSPVAWEFSHWYTPFSFLSKEQMDAGHGMSMVFIDYVPRVLVFTYLLRMEEIMLRVQFLGRH